jgi:serine/threonine protein kinase
MGKGGMGSIFLAKDTRLDDKLVVIKEMLQNFTSEE